MGYISNPARQGEFGEDADMTKTKETQRYAGGRNCRVPAPSHDRGFRAKRAVNPAPLARFLLLLIGKQRP